MIHLLATASNLGADLARLGQPEGFSTVVKIALLMTVLALLPSVLMLFTSFVRFIIVFHFLRQALGTQSFPPNQVLVGLSLLLTFVVMTPVADDIYTSSILPYQAGEIDAEQAWAIGSGEIKTWMIRNTRENDLLLFAELTDTARPQTPADVPLRVAMPAFLISELKAGFQIGFLLFIPFLVIDLVISSVLLGMGMMMLPPVIISLPFKILLFVLVDGWHLLVFSLTSSFR